MQRKIKFRQAVSELFGQMRWKIGPYAEMSKWKAAKVNNIILTADPWILKRVVMSFGKNLLTRTLRRSRVQRRNRLKVSSQGASKFRNFSNFQTKY